VWTKPEKKGEKAAKTKVIFKNYGTKVIANIGNKNVRIYQIIFNRKRKFH